MNGYGESHIGMQRNTNEDAYIVLNNGISNFSNLYIVADGMGGHKAGEVASNKSIEIFLEFINSKKFVECDMLDCMIEGIKYTNFKIYKASIDNEEYSGMGTTFTVCTIKNNKGYVCHVGDSRLYVINKDYINLVTTDHSYVNEMIRAGEITSEEAKTHPKKNILTRVLGVEENLHVDSYIFDLSKGDKILICSDGLTNMVSQETIKEKIIENISIEEIAKNLINIGNENGGIDNITVIVIEEGGGNEI